MLHYVLIGILVLLVLYVCAIAIALANWWINLEVDEYDPCLCPPEPKSRRPRPASECGSVALASPSLFGFASQRRSSGVLDLDPVFGAAGAIERAEPLRHDAFAAELARLLVHDFAVADVMRVECDALRRLAQ
jgi:hypothetical protein